MTGDVPGRAKAVPGTFSWLAGWAQVGSRRHPGRRSLVPCRRLIHSPIGVGRQRYRLTPGRRITTLRRLFERLAAPRAQAPTRDRRDEADLPTQPPQARQDPRLSGPQCHSERPKGPAGPSCQGSCAADAPLTRDPSARDAHQDRPGQAIGADALRHLGRRTWPDPSRPAPPPLSPAATQVTIPAGLRTPELSQSIPSSPSWPGPMPTARLRLGLAIAKKCARRAVDRNRLKRLVRESFRRHRPGLQRLDLVVMCRRDAVAAENTQLSASLAIHWARIRKQLCASSSSA